MSAPGLKITNFHYSNITLPKGPEGFVEYPKWVHRDGGHSCIVQNSEEEAAFLSSVNSVVTTPPEPLPMPSAPTVTLSPDNDEKSLLLALAKEKGIAVDGRWKVDKLRAAMTAAQPQAD